MKSPFLANNRKIIQISWWKMRTLFQGHKDRSSVALQSWRMRARTGICCPEHPQTSPCLLFCICSILLSLQTTSCFSPLPWQKAAVCGSQFYLVSVQGNSRHSLVSLKGQSFQIKKSDCSVSGVCRHPFHSSPIGQNLFTWPHLTVREAGLCSL